MSAINDELEKLYQDKSKAVRNSEGYRKLWLYIGKVLEKVGEKYPRFRSINVNCLETSKSAGLTTETNRFVIFNIKGSVKDIPEFPGFARFHVDSSVLGEWKNCVNRKGYLEPRKLSSKYKKYIKWALKETELDFAVDMLIDIKVRGGGAEAITITGSYSPFMWTLNSSSYKEVKWDLNLLIGCEGLAPTKLAPWLSRSAAGINIWPTFETVTEIRNTIGFGLVAANMLAEDSNVCKTASDLHIMWRYSVFRAETCILRHCQDELIHNKLLVILKAVRLYEIPEGSESTPLTSYHMKTILLHEAHDYPNPDSWKQDKLGERYVSAMERLVKSIDEKKLFHFFFLNVNLFKGRESAMRSKITGIVKNPQEHLEKLITAEEYNRQKELNAVLEKFYQEKAKSNDLDGYTELWLYIENALEEVEKKDPRFRSSKVELVGSSASGVSAILTKEMDRLVIFNIKGVITDIHDSPGFARFQVDSSVREDWKDCINKDGYLEPRRISSEFKKCFDWAVSKIKSKYPKGLPTFTEEMTEVEVEGGDSVAITISGSYGNSSWILGRVKCDLVLLIGFEGLSPTKLAPWLDESSSQMTLWPTFETVEKIRNVIGFGLVAKNVLAEDSYVCKTASDIHLMWRYSVSRAETCILRHCQDELIHKKLLVILKAVRLYEIPEGSEPTQTLTSYHMKTILLHEAHDYPDPDSWKQDKLGYRYESALKRLLKSMKENHLQHFFFPNVNLFQGAQYGMTSIIENMVENPKEYLEMLMIEEGRQPIEAEYPSLLW